MKMNRKQLALRLAAIPAFVAATAGNALAAVPSEVTTELTAAKTDVMTIGAAVFAIAVGIVLFKWFRRSL